MRKIVLFVFLLGALCANAVDVTSYYKPAQYQEARYQEAQYEASYNAARYNEAVSDMSWSNSMLGRKITITNDKGVTNRVFSTVGAPAPVFKTASGQTPHVYGGGSSSMGGILSGGSSSNRKSQTELTRNVVNTPVQVNVAQDRATSVVGSGSVSYTCPDCGTTTTVSYTVTDVRGDIFGGHLKYEVTFSKDGQTIDNDAQSGNFWDWLRSFFSSKDNDSALSNAKSKAEELAKSLHKCPDPTAPLGSSLIPLLLMLLCYALFRLVRGEVREEQEMA